MVDKNTISPTIQHALDYLCAAETWASKAAVKAHIIGLQGEKRRLRYLSRKAGYIQDTLQHSMIDIFDTELHPHSGSTDVSGMTSLKHTMDGIISKLWKIYSECHTLANKLVVDNMRPLASPIYEYCDCILTILGELNRARKEYELAEWEYHHISRYQVSWSNVHDNYEDKEESQGYKDHKEA